jgi:hypothetical protein
MLFQVELTFFKVSREQFLNPAAPEAILLSWRQLGLRKAAGVHRSRLRDRLEFYSAWSAASENMLVVYSLASTVGFAHWRRKGGSEGNCISIKMVSSQEPHRGLDSF